MAIRENPQTENNSKYSLFSNFRLSFKQISRNFHASKQHRSISGLLHPEKTLEFACVSLLFGASLLALSVAKASEPIVLTLGHVGHGGASIHGGSQLLADHLAEISDGAMTIKITGRAQLGGIRDMWIQMQTGTLDMQSINLSAISLLKQASRINVTLVPFLFRDQEHHRAYLASDLFKDTIDDITTTTNIRYLGTVAEIAPRVVSTTRKPVTSIDDMQNLRIRVPPHPVFTAVFKSWGAVPVPVPPADMFNALKTGTVEGEDNGVINMVNGRNAEVIKHFTPIDWHHSAVATWISEHTWNKLTAQQQDWMKQAMELTTRDSIVIYDEKFQASMNKLEEYGIALHEPDMAGFHDSAQHIIDKFEGTMWPIGEAERIRAIQ